MKHKTCEESVNEAITKTYGFMIIPLCKLVLSGRVFRGELGKAMDVFIVMAGHHHQLWKYKPSVDRIAALAGVSKESVRAHKKTLESAGFISNDGRVLAIAKSKNSCPNDNAIFMMKGIIHTGLWGEMTHFTRLIYLYLLANSGPGSEPLSEYQEDEGKDEASDGVSANGFRNLDPNVLAPSRLMTIVGCSRSTAKESLRFLKEMDVLHVNHGDILAHLKNSPNRHSVTILRKLYLLSINRTENLSGATKQQFQMWEKSIKDEPSIQDTMGSGV